MSKNRLVKKYCTMKIYPKPMLIFLSCFLLLFLYCILDSFKRNKPVTRSNCGKEEFLIKTPGCSLPNYAKYLTFKSTTHINGTCGPRAIFIKQVGNDKIIFQIDKKKLQKYLKKKRKITCCFRFGSTTPGTSIFTYSKCIPFENGKKFKLLQEVITITCTTRINKKSTDVVYKDSFVLVKKINKNKKPHIHSWNILVLGMSTMSRARIYNTMPRTVQYLQKNKWLDFKGYHAVGDKMLPNVISLLTGAKLSTVKKYCIKEPQKCSEMFIWRHFENEGYITAFGDDYFEVPDEVSKNTFMPPSTDHYVWPYFQAKYSQRKGNFFCTSNESSGKQLLDYAYQFVDSYKTNNFFGMFWINTFSSRIGTTPTLIDVEFVNFLQNINKNGALNNTFIMLLSDHGIKSGDIKIQKESYYETRLPMFFMWLPYEFQRRYSKEINNIHINQNRLLSPNDVYSTMMDILKFSYFISNLSSETYPQYTNSLFKEKSLQRKCADVGVDKQLCACHFLEDIDGNDARVSESIQSVINHIQNMSKAIKTIPCMTCAELNIKKVLRTHSYSDSNKIYYVIALQMSPGDISYEATVLDSGNDLSIVLPVASISGNTRGHCAIDPKDRIYCLCEITVCNIDLVLSHYTKM